MGILSDEEINAMEEFLERYILNIKSDRILKSHFESCLKISLIDLKKFKVDALKSFENGINSAKAGENRGKKITDSEQAGNAINWLVGSTFVGVPNIFSPNASGFYELMYDLGVVTGILKYRPRLMIDARVLNGMPRMLYQLEKFALFYNFLIERFKIWERTISSQSLPSEEAKLYEQIIKSI